MTANDSEPKASGGFTLGKGLIIAVVVAGGVAGYVFFGDYLSFKALEEHRNALVQWRDSNLLLAVLTYMAIYILAVTFSVPGATVLTLTGGFLFGLYLGTAATVISATIGATLIYLAAKTALRETLVQKAGPWLQKVEAEFKENEISFMLLMRLVPAVPFFAINLAAALIGVRLTTYVWTTLIGIIPGSGVYTSVGVGLDEIIARGEVPGAGLLTDPKIIGPILGLCVLAALPIIVKKLRARRPTAS